MDIKMTGMIHDIFRVHENLSEWWEYRNETGMKKILTPPAHVLAKYPYAKEKYARNILYKCPVFEWVVIKWLPGQSTSIHGHPLGGCVFFLLVGSLTETRYHKQDQSFLYTVQLTPESDIQYIDDTLYIHRVENTSTTPATSIHLYSPPFQI